MKRRVCRFLVALVALVCLLTGSAVPASAGTLTSATFTAPSGWTTTGASGARYDWGFTTATTATVSKVTASVPTGTGGKDRYLALNGTTGNIGSTADSNANSIAGDLDIRARIRPSSWTGSDRSIASKADFSAGGRSWEFALSSSGGLTFNWSSDGSNFPGFGVPNRVPFDNGTVGWLRVTFQTNDGAGNRRIAFYTSSDGSTWAPLGPTSTTAGTTSTFDSPAPVRLGTGGNGLLRGSVYAFELRSGIDGTVVNKFDPNEAAPQSPSSWAASTGETWNVNRSGTNLPADIATDLSVGTIEGLPGGGSANYRLIDGIATYNLPTAITINAGTSVKLNLGSFTNTATPGSYASTIRTLDNSGTPAVVDSATTAALVFAESANTANVNIAVSPALTFTTTSRNTTCNGATVDVTSTANSMSFGRLNNATATGAQNLAVSTNAEGGYTVFVRRTYWVQNSSGRTIPSITPTNAAPGAFPNPGTEAWAYTVDDSSLATGTPNRFTVSGPRWASISAINSEVAAFASPVANRSTCFAMRLQTNANTPAGNYFGAIAYTAVPRF